MKTIRRTHSAVVRLGFGALVFLVLAPIVLNARQSIEWELVNPFPFIHDRDSVDDLRRAYSELPNRSSLGLERALQRANETVVENRRDLAMGACLATGAEEKECVKKYWYPYLGWFHDIARNSHAKTCWDSSALEFRKSNECAQYFDPKFHRVRAWIDNSTITNPENLVWSGNNSSLLNLNACDAKFQKQICVEFDVPYSASETSPGLDVVLRAGAGEIIGATARPIKVFDVLIAGLGDSFASGEGNPDIPAQFMTNESDTDFLYFWKWRRLPRKDKVNPDGPSARRPTVEWLDRRCHRSMYSYQFKAALRYALEHPQRSVTFVSFACSGATTANIFEKGSEQKAQEAMPRDSIYYRRGGRTKIKLQLEALKEVIGTRPIDVLLLSTGGNDIEFSDYVAYVVTSGKTRWVKGKTPKRERIRREIAQLGVNYLALQRAIFDRVSGVRIKGCGEKQGCERIVLTPYPNVFTDENGRICDVSRNEFSMPFNRDLGRGRRAKSLHNELFLPLGEFQSGVRSQLGWSVANSTSDNWQGHGFCSQDRLSKGNLEERFIMPQRRNWVWKAYRPGKDNAERELGRYEPWKYNTYASRFRWIRLPIDSKLTADQQRRFWKFSIDFLFEDESSSVMHPTAEGHANNADANHDVLNRLLN